jgi:hypothetical protein
VLEALSVESGRFSDDEIFDAPIEATRCAIDHILPKGRVTLLVGPGGVGKSTLIAQMCISVCSDIAFHGHAVTSGAVLVLSLEDPRDQYQRRIREAAKAKGLGDKQRKQLVERLFVFDLFGQNFQLTDEINGSLVQNGVVAEEIGRICDEIGNVQLIVLETVSRFMRGGQENNNSDVAVFMEAVENIARLTEAAVMVTHHTGKGKTSESYPGRGATAFQDNARSALVLEQVGRSSKGRPKWLPAAELERGRVLVLRHSKANLTAMAESMYWTLNAGTDGPYVLPIEPLSDHQVDQARQEMEMHRAKTLLKFLRADKGRYSCNALEGEELRPVENNRNKTRAAVSLCLELGWLENRLLPLEERQGARQMYLAVTSNAP